MATTDKLQKLIDTKEAIKEAIINKGVSIADTDTFASYPDKISSIKSGGVSVGSLDFGRINYQYPPYFLQDSMDESEEYYNNFTPNTFTINEKIMFVPKVEINVNNPITFNTSSPNLYKFGTCFPAAIVFPDIDFNNLQIDCRNLFYVAGINSNFQSIHLKNIKPTSFENGFSWCRALTDLTFNNVDLSICNSTASMFEQCSFSSYNMLRELDFSNVKIVSEMFTNNTNLTTFDGSVMKNIVPTKADKLFYYCENLTEVDFTSWDFSKCTTFSSMFQNCKKIQKIKGVIDLISDNTYFENFSFTTSSSSTLTTIYLKNLCAYKSDYSGTLYFSLYYNKWGTGDEESQQSFIYSINNMYDRVAAGYTKTMTCNFTDAQKALLTDDMIASLTSKGYTIA